MRVPDGARVVPDLANSVLDSALVPDVAAAHAPSTIS